MKTALLQYIEDLKNGTCKGEEYYLELEKERIINFAHRCRIIDTADLNGNVSFIFTPELQFELIYNNQ